MHTVWMRYDITLSLCLCFAWMMPANGQTSASGDLFQYITDIIIALPGAGGDDYADPSTAEIANWQLALEEVMNGDYTSADSIVQLFGYRVVLFQDTTTGISHVVLEQLSVGTNYWGTYVFNPAACRSELILMSPHPKKDLNTGKQGIYCYLQCDALGFMLAGTNRCNALAESPCSGTTSVCGGGSSPYRTSDLAHSITSIWQSTVHWLKDSMPETYFVQLHGFAKQEDDPYVIMSNGTRETPHPDKIAALRDYLDIVDPVLTFRIGHEDLGWTRLLGFTNTNGRLLNESPDPCSTAADETYGRFLHVEQEKTRLRQDISGWNKMARALAAAFRGNGCPAVVPVNDYPIWYVREGMTGDGRSWSDANGYLRGVLHLADAGDTICIGAGTYKISLYDDPLETIDLHDGITLLGGFPSTGGSFVERDWESYQTIISGDIGTPGVTSDNSLGLLRELNMGDTVIIDGLHLKHTAPSVSAALEFSGNGCIVLGNVSLADIWNADCVFNAQELIIGNVTISSTVGIQQTLILNQGVLHIGSSTTVGN